MKTRWEFLALAFIPITIFAQSEIAEAEAIDLIAKGLSYDHLECVSFVTEAATSEYFEIALREKHSIKCGGDPATAPVIERFRINRSDRSISKYDAIIGEYSAPKTRGIK